VICVAQHRDTRCICGATKAVATKMCPHKCVDHKVAPHYSGSTESVDTLTPSAQGNSSMNHQHAVNPLSVGVEDGARMIGVARSMFYEILARGELKSFKLGRRRLVLVKDMEAYINRQAQENSR